MTKLAAFALLLCSGASAVSLLKTETTTPDCRCLNFMSLYSSGQIGCGDGAEEDELCKKVNGVYYEELDSNHCVKKEMIGYYREVEPASYHMDTWCYVKRE